MSLEELIRRLTELRDVGLADLFVATPNENLTVNVVTGVEVVDDWVIIRSD